MKGVLIDTHCHLEEYPDPTAVIRSLDGTSILTLAVTIAPSTYERSRTLFRGERHVRLALGAHPLHVAKFPEMEWRLFQHYLPETTYIGEVGLDFSSVGIGSRTAQEQAFRRVLRAVAGRGKVISLHSRRAEETVLNFLEEFNVGPAIFHWYTGPTQLLDRLLKSGHYLSINPAMLRNPRGRAIVDRIPFERILIETDGPFVKVGSRVATPIDIYPVYEYFALSQRESQSAVISHIYQNFSNLLSKVSGQ